jgi:hypothetical protein
LTDVIEHDPAWATLSTETRLADAVGRRVTDCGCTNPAITVLRGFDASSRRRAVALKARLRRAGILTTVAAAPMVNAHHVQGNGFSLPPARVDGHLCALVDATVGGRLEVDRIGGWTGVPVVALAVRPPRAPATEVRPLIRVEFPVDPLRSTTAPFPSATGRVVGIAFETVHVEPNQPETGQLVLRLADDLPQAFPTGTTVRVRLLDAMLQISAYTAAEGERLWISDVATVEQVSGLHTVRRDGLMVADVDTSVRFEARPQGLVTDYA